MVAIYLVPKSEIERDILYTGPNNTVRNDVRNGISKAVVLKLNSLYLRSVISDVTVAAEFDLCTQIKLPSKQGELFLQD